MPRTKKATPAKPKTGEVIQFADLRAMRDVRRADMRLSVHVVKGEGERGDLVLCGLKSGGFTFARVTVKREENGASVWEIDSRDMNIDCFYGRVVLIENAEEGGAA